MWKKGLIGLCAACMLYSIPVSAAGQNDAANTVGEDGARLEEAETSEDLEGLESLEGLEGYDQFETAAKGCIVMEAETGRVLYGNQIHTRLPMASTTKIMGALIVLEQPDLDSYFTVDSNAIHVEGSSMGLQEGDQVSLRALAYGMILPSGNDAANAAAVRISGSVPVFVDEMNRKAEELGLQDTHYVTACGLDADEHYSSAFDLAKLTRIALRNPEFAEICAQYQAQVNFGNPPFDRWLKNHNRLLEMYDDCIGVKTGFTDAARRCLVSAARRDGMTLICVTLNAADDWNIHMSLYNQYFDQYQMTDVTSGLKYPEIPVAGGIETMAASELAWAPQVPLKQGEMDRVSCMVLAEPMIYAPVKKGDVVGEAVFSVDDLEFCRVPLLAKSAVEEAAPYKESKNRIDRIKDFVLQWVK